MSAYLTEAERRQLWSLIELAGSPQAVIEAERHLSLLFARRPSLHELVDELMERRRRACPEAEPDRVPLVALAF